MPPKGRKKAAVAKSNSAEVDAEFPPIEKILQDKSQPAKSGRGRKKADAADDETIIVGQVGIVEGDGDVGNGISNGTKMNGGGTPNNEEKMDPFDRLLLEGTTKKDDWRLEFSPDASRMSPKNGAEKESGDLESDDGDFKSNSKTSSVVAEAGSTRAKEDIEQVSDEEVEDPEVKDTPEEADEESEEVLGKSSDKKAVEEESEEEIEEAQEEDEPEEPNVEVEKVPEKRGRKKVVEEDIEEVEKAEEPEKVVGRRGRKKAEVVTEEPKKVLAKRGRKKADVVEEQEEVDNDDEPEEEKPPAKRGRKKAEIPDEVDDDEIEEKEKPVAKRGRKKLEDAEKEKTEEEPPKSKRGRKKAEVLDIADEESEKEQEKPAPKRGRRKGEVEVVEIADEKSEEELEPEKPKGRRGRPAKPAEVQIEDSQEPEKPRAMRGRKKAEVVELEEEKPAAKRGRKKAEVPEVAEEPERTTGKRGRKKAEVVEAETVEEPAKGKKGRKRKADVPESPSKRGKEDYDEDDISDFAGKELRVAMTRSQEIDEMARKASPPHKEAGKPSDETYVMAKPAKEQPAKSGRKRANQDPTDAKPEKNQKEEPAKQGKSGAKRAQIPDVSALDFGSDAKTTDDQPWNFKIASWNVNGVRAWLEKGGMSYLEHEDPDVLCIQETKCSKDKLPEELEIDGYHCHWLAGDKEGYSGVGLISKTKPVSISEGIGIKEHDNEGRVITAEFEKFYLVNAYVPNAGRGLVRLDYRKTWDEDFRAYLKKLDNKKPVVLCGDLNVAHEEIDIANPKSNKKNAGFTQEERDGFSALLEEGFIDTFRHLYPDEKGAYTFWTYMMNCRAKNVGWRLDYFVISERFKDHLCDSVIRKDVMGSDHCPVGLLLHI